MVKSKGIPHCHDLNSDLGIIVSWPERWIQAPTWKIRVMSRVDLGGMSHVVFNSAVGYIINTVKRQSRLSFHVFVAVPMGRAFFRCRLF